MYLKEFITEQNKAIFRLPSTNDSTSLLYLKALAYGIDRALDEYRQHLASLEQKVQAIWSLYRCSVHCLV